MKTKQHPPSWADKLLSWFCKEEVLENVQGDLHEIYHMRVDSLGRRRANLLFIRDVLGVLRPRLIKRSEGSRQLNQYGIFKNYLKTSLRTIKRNALFSGINVVGLAISMSVGLLMIVLLSELNSFDDFHEKRDRIYRVTTSRNALFHGEAEYYATAPHYIADQIAQVAGVEQILVLDRKLSADIKSENKGISVTGYYATASFFDVLSFKLKKGNPRTALDKPGAIVLTESASRKLFGDVDPLDKIIVVESNPDFQTGVVTGVVEDPPVNSHLDFEALVSMKTIENSLVPRRRNFKNNPGNYAQSYVYLVLSSGANISDIEATMGKIMAEHNSHSAPNTLLLQPMKEFATTDAGYQPGPAFSKTKINMMIILTLVVLASACFNYTNLSLVRALRRSKEICVRKITGANRLQVFLQFMTEAMVLSIIALIAGVGLFLLIKTEFLSLGNLTTGNRAMFLLDLAPSHIIYFLVFAIVIGCFAGFVPALVLSKLRASSLFNDASKFRVFSGVTARQVLITCQITLSIGLITCAVIVHKQYKFALSYDLGYDTENIVNIRIEGDYIDALANEYAKVAEVVSTSKSAVALGTREMIPGDALSEDRSDTIMFSCNYVDSKYLSMHGFELIAGSGFSDELPNGEVMNSVVVNEEFLKELQLGTAEQAIGKQIWYFGELKLKIKGVVRDFVGMSLDAEAPGAFGFVNGGEERRTLGVKISGSDLLSTMVKLEEGYKKLDPVHPFVAKFYNDQIAKTYEQSKTTYKVVSFLALLAISISTLGLLGIAVFSLESRMKELSIRKILGAGIQSLVILLSRSLLVMIAVAAVTAIPLTLYVIDDFVLNEFIYRTEIGMLEIFSGLAVILTIGMVTIMWQVRMAAIQNPVDLLRDE